MKIKLSTKILNFKEQPFQYEKDIDLTLGIVIAEALASDQSGGKMKLYNLSQKAFKSKEMEVDNADLALIKKSVESSKLFQGNALILGQALDLLEKVKEDK